MSYETPENIENRKFLVEEIRREYLEGKNSVLLSFKIIVKENFAKSNLVGMAAKIAEDSYVSAAERLMDEIANSEFGLDQEEGKRDILIKKYNLIKKYGYKNIADYVFDTYRGSCLYPNSQMPQVPEWYKKWDDLNFKLTKIEVEETISEVASGLVNKEK